MWGTPTHLLLVNRAFAALRKFNRDTEGADANVSWLLELYDDPRTGLAAGLVNGLIEADYLAPFFGVGFSYGGVAYATWHPHFYDPDTRKNYLGDDDTAVGRGAENFGLSLVELDTAMGWAGRPESPANAPLSKAGWRLGVALHFFSDLLQPMHAANFTNCFGYNTASSLRDLDGLVRQFNLADKRHSWFESLTDDWAEKYLDAHDDPVAREDVDVVAVPHAHGLLHNMAVESKVVFHQHMASILQNWDGTNDPWKKEYAEPIWERTLKLGPRRLARFLAYWAQCARTQDSGVSVAPGPIDGLKSIWCPTVDGQLAWFKDSQQVGWIYDQFPPSFGLFRGRPGLALTDGWQGSYGVLARDGRLMEIINKFGSPGGPWKVYSLAAEGGLPALRFQGSPAASRGVNGNTFAAITADRHLAYISSTHGMTRQVTIEFPAGQDLRFQGRPALSGRQSTVVAVTSEGRLAISQKSSDGWHVEYIGEALRFRGSASVVELQDKTAVYVVTSNGRLAQLWNGPGFWEVTFPCEHTNPQCSDLRFQDGPAAFLQNGVRSVCAITSDGQLAQLWVRRIWEIDFPARLSGHPAVRCRRGVAVLERGDKKFIYVVTTEGRLAQLWDTDRWNLDFPAEQSETPASMWAW